MNRVYHPGRAWSFAALYFLVCIGIASVTGIVRRVAAEPLATAAQVHDTTWVVATALVTAFAVFGYVCYWPRGTVAHGRPRNALALLFGIAWGVSQALLVLSLFEWLDRATSARWLSTLLTVLGWSIFAGLWQSRFWDVYVAPEHNIRDWNLRKVLFVHVPFLVLSVAHYAAFENVSVFVAWWVLALVTSAWVMRFPPPWHPPSRARSGHGT